MPSRPDPDNLIDVKRQKVLVAMSGGVDSSVAALILKQQGYEVVGCFMRHGGAHEFPSIDTIDPTGSAESCNPAKSHKQGCCSVNDADDARHVAALLDIPLYVLNFERDFDRIIDYFVADYNAGRTPNPCVRCNDWLKFGKLFDYADSIGADYVATGHYARIEKITTPHPTTATPTTGSHHALCRGRDTHKDQSYVLFGTPRHRLDRMLLPVGDFENKAALRQIAQDHNLPVFNKPDSQEICFVPDQDYARLVANKSADADKPKPGRIIDTHGHDLGEHPGHQHYTIGQRRGLSISLGHPIYVTHKDPNTNTVTVGQSQDLLTDRLIATDTNSLPPTPFPRMEWNLCQVKVRANMDPVPGRFRFDETDDLEITFDHPQRAISPGQAAVIYTPDAHRVLGGGWIR